MSRRVRADRNAHLQRIAEATERAATVDDTRKLYQLVKQSSRRSAPSNESMLDHSGGVITSLEGQLARWEEQFAELLNHIPPPASTNSPSADVSAPTYECKSDSPTVDEIRAIIQRLKNNKSPGEDALPPEVFKQCSDILAPWHLRVITKVMELELITEYWSESVILLLFNKGDRRQCSYYRGISVIDIAA